MFIGDSITRNWGVSGMFANAVNTGLPGENSFVIKKQTVPQLVATFPNMVHILAGTNDNIDTKKAEVVRNVRTLGLIAIGMGAKTVVIGTIPPLDAKRFPMQQMNAKGYNSLLKTMARANGFKIADYNAAMSAPDGSYRAELFIDGIHPNAQGYRAMQKVLIATLGK